MQWLYACNTCSAALIVKRFEFYHRIEFRIMFCDAITLIQVLSLQVKHPFDNFALYWM